MSPRPVPIPIPGIQPRLPTSTAMYTNNPGKLAMLSHSKLQDECAADEPCLRRCVGHNAVLSNTMSAARDRYKSSTRFTENDEIDTTYRIKPKKNDESPVSVIRGQIAKAVKAIVPRKDATTTITTSTTGTGTKTTTETAPKKGYGLVRVQARELHDKVRQNTDDKKIARNTAHPRTGKNSIAIKSRQCVSWVFSARKFWVRSVLAQASVG